MVAGRQPMGYNALCLLLDNIPAGCASSASRRPKLPTTKSTSMLATRELRDLNGRRVANEALHVMKGKLSSEQLRQGQRQTTRARTKYYQLFQITRLQLRPAGYNDPTTAPPLTNAKRSPQGHRLYASPGFTGGQVATTPALPGSNHLPKANFTPVRSTG